MNDQRYFITFIRYMYLYLLNDKSEALDAFKVYKAEVEKQSGLSIKIVRSDRVVSIMVGLLTKAKDLVHLLNFLRKIEL